LWRGLLKNTRKDGTLYDAEFTVVPVVGDHRFVSVHRDVTQARQYEEMQRRFISDAAHDLGNPVANLNLHLDLMQRKPEHADRYLRIIRHETERLDALVQDLLILSRLDRGILAQHVEALDLRQIVQRVIENQKEAALTKNITLLYDPASDPLLFNGDRRQIERVVVNLISNALDYTPEGGEVLVMSILEDQNVVFAVRDTGIGISPKDLPHIFERFYRADTARLMSVKGSGLGLSIVKSIVENHGGEIRVTSSPGEGTYFHIAFPC
ncbi:MAG: HAMP domain-containing histidine kinase, partial [Anaerolineae bacterium]|nr:HAMP domain-containing histidine kinase [Anaerolineae bacterium]